MADAAIKSFLTDNLKGRLHLLYLHIQDDNIHIDIISILVEEVFQKVGYTVIGDVSTYHYVPAKGKERNVRKPWESLLIFLAIHQISLPTQYY